MVLLSTMLTFDTSMSPPIAEDQLHEHVLGKGSPCGSLLNEGVLPDGWVDRYLELLATISDSYSGSDMLPRRTIWDVKFASWYLPIRFDVWRNSTGKSNSDTVRQLARIRTPSELFFTDGLDHCEGSE